MKTLPTPPILPILMNQFSSRANVLGLKTQTRRDRGLHVVNERPDHWKFMYFTNSVMNLGKRISFTEQPHAIFEAVDGSGAIKVVKFPYGDKGTVLWGRETWQITDFLNKEDDNYGYIYRASDNGKDWEDNSPEWKWRPSIHMPKAAARQWMRVTGFRVERLNDIMQRPEDAIAEGIVRNPEGYMLLWKEQPYFLNDPSELYITLLRMMHGNAWVDNNPWLWVVEYEVMSTTGRPDGI